MDVNKLMSYPSSVLRTESAADAGRVRLERMQAHFASPNTAAALAKTGLMPVMPAPSLSSLPVLAPE